MEKSEGHDLGKVGATCSILVGISYILVGIFHLQIPLEQRAAMGNPDGFYTSLAQNPTFSLLEWWALALGAVFAFAAVPAISERLRAFNEGWVRWTSALALLGYAVEAMVEFRSIARHPIVASIYVKSAEATKAAIAAEPVLFIDPQGWLRFGVIGLWVFVVSVLTLLKSTQPKPLAYVGLAAAPMLWLAVAGFVFGSEMLISIAAGLGGVILAPIWFIWWGLILRK